MTREQENKNIKVVLQIDGVNHHLRKYKGYSGGGKHKWICPECSLYKTHGAYCWSVLRDCICSALAMAASWDDNFQVYFKTI